MTVTEPSVAPSSPSDLSRRYDEIRRRSEQLAEPLPVEDQVVQTRPEASPTKWHLAHTAWFFETFVAAKYLDDYEVFCEDFGYLFNSYYKGAGPCFERSRRGTIGRPGVETIGEYRAYVDDAIGRLFESGHRFEEWAPIIEIGLNHEQQHQELILTDIKTVLAANPMEPAYRPDCAGFEKGEAEGELGDVDWLEMSGGIDYIGFEGSEFAFDNERPRHRVVVDDFKLASRPVSCGEFIEFIEDGGYDDHRLWLSDGWETVQTEGWQAPLYWRRRGDQWWTMTLGGMRPVDANEPICHVSYYEADAFARWSGRRLPTEAEWEIASRIQAVEGHFAESERFHPRRYRRSDGPRFFGDVWEWTASPYRAYPGFEPWDETLGEYTGKFMCNQFVLRGGACVTPADHIRRTYRNFFYPDARWQFSGFRLAA